MRKTTLSKVFFYAILPLAAAGLVIFKVFLIRDCLAFDPTDDGKQIACLQVARMILQRGDVPMMNIFNFFGIPLLGDNLSYFFSPLAVSYYLLPGAVAMTVNRALMAFLTLLALTLFFARRMSRPSAFLSACLVLFAPGFFHHLAHHHFQMSLFWTILLFYFEEKMDERREKKYLALFYAAFVLFLLSTSSNVILISLPFLLLKPLLHSRASRRTAAYAAGAMILALIFVWPDLQHFLYLMQTSFRAQVSYNLSLPEPLVFSFLMGKGPVSFYGRWIYFSLPVLATAAAGIWILIKKNASAARQVIILGVCPLMVVLLLLLFPDLSHHLPLVRSTDVTRILWIACIFLAWSAGSAADAFRAGPWPSGTVKVLLPVYAALTVVIYFFSPLTVSVLVAVPLLAYPLTVILCDRARGQRNRKVFYGLFVLCLLGTRLPVLNPILGLQTPRQCFSAHWFAPRAFSEYLFPPLAKALPPLSRVTHEATTAVGLDFRLMPVEIFGAQSRSTFQDAKLTKYLDSLGLIRFESELGDFHFKGPWRSALLSDLGIQYVIRMGNEAPEERTSDMLPVTRNEFAEVYRNPLETGIARVQFSGKQRVIKTDRMRFIGNGLTFELPESDQKGMLRVTLLDRPGWKAFVDGRRRMLVGGKDPFIYIPLNAGDRFVKLIYHPWEIRDFALFALTSVAAMVLLLLAYGAGTLKETGPR